MRSIWASSSLYMVFKFQFQISKSPIYPHATPRSSVWVESKSPALQPPFCWWPEHPPSFPIRSDKRAHRKGQSPLPFVWKRPHLESRARVAPLSGQPRPATPGCAPPPALCWTGHTAARPCLAFSSHASVPPPPPPQPPPPPRPSEPIARLLTWQWPPPPRPRARRGGPRRSPRRPRRSGARPPPRRGSPRARAPSSWPRGSSGAGPP